MAIVFDPVLAGIIVGLIVSLVSATILGIARFKYNKKIKEKEAESKRIEDLCNEQQKTRKAVWRLNKTVVIIAKLIDEQTKKSHPELVSDLESITEELLKDDINL